jgi:hypothetical protein
MAPTDDQIAFHNKKTFCYQLIFDQLTHHKISYSCFSRSLHRIFPFLPITGLHPALSTNHRPPLTIKSSTNRPLNTEFLRTLFFYCTAVRLRGLWGGGGGLVPPVKLLFSLSHLHIATQFFYILDIIKITMLYMGS